MVAGALGRNVGSLRRRSSSITSSLGCSIRSYLHSLDISIPSYQQHSPHTSSPPYSLSPVIDLSEAAVVPATDSFHIVPFRLESSPLGPQSISERLSRLRTSQTISFLPDLSCSQAFLARVPNVQSATFPLTSSSSVSRPSRFPQIFAAPFTSSSRKQSNTSGRQRSRPNDRQNSRQNGRQLGRRVSIGATKQESRRGEKIENEQRTESPGKKETFRRKRTGDMEDQNVGRKRIRGMEEQTAGRHGRVKLKQKSHEDFRQQKQQQGYEPSRQQQQRQQQKGYEQHRSALTDDTDSGPVPWRQLAPVHFPSLLPVQERGRKGGGMREGEGMSSEGEAGGVVSARKWVAVCCPHMPASLVHKLFRKRLVRAFSPLDSSSSPGTLGPSHARSNRLSRVTASQMLLPGTILCIPSSVQLHTDSNANAPTFLLNDGKRAAGSSSSSLPRGIQPEDIKMLQNCVLFKDEHIIVINKPPGLPSQGGYKVRLSVDNLMQHALAADSPEPLRLVHRLDRETSGAMLLARSPASARVLSALFREKSAAGVLAAAAGAANGAAAAGAAAAGVNDAGDESDNVDATSAAGDEGSTAADWSNEGGVARVYWAVVIGRPKQLSGVINAPLHRPGSDSNSPTKELPAVTLYRVIQSCLLDTRGWSCAH